MFNILSMTCKFKGLLLHIRYWVKVWEAAVVKYQKFGFQHYKQVKYNINYYLGITNLQVEYMYINFIIL